jgi:hypothetical protein
VTLLLLPQAASAAAAAAITLAEMNWRRPMVTEFSFALRDAMQFAHASDTAFNLFSIGKIPVSG